MDLDRRSLLRAAAGLAALGTLSACSAMPADVPRPTGRVVTRWLSDPWAQGSYSALLVGGAASARQTLTGLIEGRMALAGEYTATDFPATVHGAYLSGERAAGQISQALGGAGAVAVIGAGLAGLRAAAVLRDKGHQVTVIEARDRVGGRVSTNTSLGFPVEEGASWLHGVTGNPLVPLVAAAGLSLVPTDFDNVQVRSFVNGNNAPQVAASNAELAATIARGWAEEPDPQSSVARVLRTSGWNPSSPAQQLSEMTELVMEFGVDLDRLGSQALWEGDELPGGDAMVAGGFSAVPELMAQGLDIRLSTPASSVDVTPTGAIVTTEAGQFDFAAVVVAVPLAVIAAGDVRLPLPPAVTGALANLGTGNLEKVFLTYPEAWWPGAEVLQVLSAPGLRWCEWFNLETVVNAPAVAGLIGGSAARNLARNDDVLADEAAGVLQQAFGQR